MTTRLAVFCDKLLEAGWLAALIVVPLFFDIYSSRVFEPDKLSLLRSIALVMVAAWIVRQIESRRVSPQQVNGNGGLHPALTESLRGVWRTNPLLLPTSVLIVVYLISTVFSVAGPVSLWGSYQRMQGTYTTFSYIVVFLIAANSLRTQVQFDRAVSTILATAFPIAFYGIIQHYQIDPLPWAGDVTLRVASNMGNSIFVAAYLIMVLPLAFARWLETLVQWSAPGGKEIRVRAPYVGIAVVMVVLSAGLWLIDFVLGAAFAILLLLLFYLLAPLLNTNPRTGLLLAAYTNILSALAMTIVFSQSRGPMVGLVAGLFVSILLGLIVLRQHTDLRWLWVAWTGLALAGGVFIVIFNLPSTPLEPLKKLPYVGRLGNIFETEGGTGKVRELIWQGDVPLILPHAPLWSPITGDDPFNAIRPLVGYGPETMYVVYNSFYPPDLAHYESRNASPDRSHNETFDSLVITGLLGFGAYILLYISIVYFILKWLGIITNSAERNAFVALWLACGFIVALGFGYLRGWYYVGVALPAGMMMGLFIFLVVIALRRSRVDVTPLDPTRVLWFCVLLCVLIGHFIEINFGIAIASTRLYFWFYGALLVILGMNRLRDTAPAPATLLTTPRPMAEESPRGAARRRRNRRQPELSRKPNVVDGGSTSSVLPWTAIVTLILITLAFEFFTNQTGTASALDALQKSLFTKGGVSSYGVFILVAFAWTTAGIIGLNSVRGRVAMPIALFVVLSLTVVLWYALLHLRTLTQPSDTTDGLISLVGLYYVAMFVVIGAVALTLVYDEPGTTIGDWVRLPVTALVAPVLAVVVAVTIYTTNFAGIAGDILYKVGLNNDNAGAWDRSIAVYERALELQPSQDFYALFLGRAYLESARVQTDPAKRAAALNASQQILSRARQINPLNTDHSANLARLQRTWATLVDDPAQRAAHLQQSIQYYQDTLRLSPNTAHLHDELAQTYMQNGEPDKAREQLEISLRLDQLYPPTFVYMGDYYRSTGESSKAADYYLSALALDPSSLMNPDNSLQDGPASVLAQASILPRAVISYTAVISSSPDSIPARMGLAVLYKRNGQLDLARRQFEEAVKRAPNDYLIGLALVNFLSETGQIDDAVTAMRRVVDLATQAHSVDLARFQDFYSQLQNLQRQLQVSQKAPDDVNAHRSLAALWKARGQPQFALPEYETIVHLAPADYDAQKNVALIDLQLSRLEDAQVAAVAAARLAPDNEKAIWQNLQVAINAQKAKQMDQAVSAAQAALALAGDSDKAALQAYVTALQDKSAALN